MSSNSILFLLLQVPLTRILSISSYRLSHKKKNDKRNSFLLSKIGKSSTNWSRETIQKIHQWKPHILKDLHVEMEMIVICFPSVCRRGEIKNQENPSVRAWEM